MLSLRSALTMSTSQRKEVSMHNADLTLIWADVINFATHGYVISTKFPHRHPPGINVKGFPHAREFGIRIVNLITGNESSATDIGPLRFAESSGKGQLSGTERKLLRMIYCTMTNLHGCFSQFTSNLTSHLLNIKSLSNESRKVS